MLTANAEKINPIAPREIYSEPPLYFIRQTFESPPPITPLSLDLFLYMVNKSVKLGGEEKLLEIFDQYAKDIVENVRREEMSRWWLVKALSEITGEQPKTEKREADKDQSVLCYPRPVFLVLGLGCLPDDRGFPATLDFIKSLGYGDIRDDALIAFGLSETFKKQKERKKRPANKYPQPESIKDKELFDRLIEVLTTDRSYNSREEFMDRVRIVSRWNDLASNSSVHIIGNLLFQAPYLSDLGGFTLNKIVPIDERKSKHYDSRRFIQALVAIGGEEADSILVDYYEKLTNFRFSNEQQRVIFLRAFLKTVGEAELTRRYRREVNTILSDKEREEFFQQILDAAPFITRMQSRLVSEDYQRAAEEAKKIVKVFRLPVEVDEKGIHVASTNRLVRLLFWDQETDQHFKKLGLIHPKFFGEGYFNTVTSILTSEFEIEGFEVPAYLWDRADKPKPVYLGFDPIKGVLILMTFRVPSKQSETIAQGLLEYLGLGKFDEVHSESYDRSSLVNYIYIVELKKRFLEDFDLIDPNLN
jgi:hypothetical protein